MDRCTNRKRKRERDCIGRRTIWTDVQIERKRERERLHWKENNMDRCTNRERERETALEGEQLWTDVQIERERERETALEGEQYGQMYK